MVIGGLQRFSLIDYPDKICAIIFTQGCNFKCSYCHNPELVPLIAYPPRRASGGQTIIPEEEIFSFLQKRQGKLDAVEVTGGEPTLQSDLLEFLQRIKKLGYLIKLDSNGSNPAMLKRAVQLKIIDYLALDVKAPLGKYEKIVKVKVNINRIEESIKLIMHSGLNYEFRTTIVQSQLTPDDVVRIGKLLKGAKKYVLQKFVPAKTLDKKFLQEKPYSDEELTSLRDKIKGYVAECLIR